jgi:dipeptidyl aminopeptidase/acylaminoacyl peptidase
MMNPWVGRSVLAALIAIYSVLGRAESLITPEKALDYRCAVDLHFSPDETTLAFIVLAYRDDYAPHVWLMDIASGVSRDITPPKKSERSPQWSPDGKTLAFLSNRGGKVQVYAMPAAGGEPTPITAQKNGVTTFHWSPDGRMIAYLGKDDDAPTADSLPHIADDARNLAHLWLIDIASKERRDLGKTGFRIDDFQWQNAEHILAVATDMPQVEEFNPAVYSISTQNAAFAPIAHPPQPFDSLAVSPDGKEFTVRASAANGPLERDLFVGTVGRDFRRVSVPGDLAIADIRRHEKYEIWARVVDGFYYRLYRFDDGALPQRIDLPLSVQSFDVSPDGRVAFAGTDFDHPSEIYMRETNGAVRQLSHLQQGWDGVSLALTTIFHTKSFDGTDIEAALMRPRTAHSNERLPLVLLVHGGPSSNFSAEYGWETAWAQMLVSHDYEVLLVNPRGSNGYSEKFLEANRGDWGGGDYKDLMAVLDAVIAKGETDADRLGIGGWSYGGEMTAWAITQTSRFKAAVAGAGVFDQAAEFDTEHNPAGDEWYFGTPWEHPEVFARNSPSTYVRNAHTPTLIFDGEDDASNPVGQSKGLYRALKHLGVETQMVLYPDEGHSPRRWSFNLDMFTRILDWYDGHLKGSVRTIPW